MFTGNPGTGKTTVARLLAGVFKDLGVLEKGQLIETDRSGLVAEYIGQTAVKTNKIIEAHLMESCLLTKHTLWLKVEVKIMATRLLPLCLNAWKTIEID